MMTFQMKKAASEPPSCGLMLLFITVLFVSSFLSTTTTTCVVAEEAEILSRGMISITRSIESEKNVDSINDECDFAGKIVLGGYFSLEQGDKFFTIGSRQLTAFNLVVDDINRYKCGLKLLGLGPDNAMKERNYALELRTYDDQSTTTGASAVAERLVNDTSIDIMLGGYSSTLTQPYVEIAHNYSDKLVLAPGAADTNVFLDKPLAFGFFPPTSKYLLQAIEALATVNGAKSIATVWEDAAFTRGVCAAAPELAEKYGMKFISGTEVANTPNVTVLDPIAEILKEANPDVVVTCVYDCAPWMEAMRNQNWSPKAQVFTVCVGSEKFSNQAGTDTAYIMGVTPWDSSLQIEDAVTGWSATKFANRMRKELSGDDTADVPYQAACAAALISVLYQTIQEVGEFRGNGLLLADYISKNTFRTMGGAYSFDENGQSKAPSLMIQYDAYGIVQTVYPPDASSGPILYPMPSWSRRDCIQLSLCEGREDGNYTDIISTDNACDEIGMCVCGDLLNFQPVGSGASAACIPLEDMNYISRPLLVVSWILVGLLLVCCAICLGWTYYYREKTLVKVSQPLFLAMIVAGSILSSMSIIPMGVEASYREDTDNIKAIDAACMAIPWLWGMGFAITYSALFAKVWRVQKLYMLAAQMRRKTVSHQDVYFIIVIVVAIEMVVLLAFQFVSPHIWNRDVIQDIGGYATESIGTCDSDRGWWFFAALVIINVICLFLALIICWKSKDIPSVFAEGNYIFFSVMFMFQILVLAVPVSAMVRDDNNVFFFIRIAAVFMQNFTVLVLIFMPKMRRIYTGEDTASIVQNAIQSWIADLSSKNHSYINYECSSRHSASSRMRSEHDSELSESGPGSFRASLQSPPSDTGGSGPMDVKNGTPDEGNGDQKMKKRVSWTNGAEFLPQEMNEVLKD